MSADVRSDKVYVAAHGGERHSGWFAALLEAVARRRPQASGLTDAALVIPGIDPLNAHFPAYATILKHAGGPEAFFAERERRVDAIWSLLEEQLLPACAPCQRVLLFDLESSHVPSSAACHRRKRLLPASVAPLLVHCSIASSTSNYRVGIDVSFPGVIPDSLGDAAQARVPCERRPVLFSFKGVCSHPVRKPLYELHNGADQICLDVTKARLPTELRRQLNRHAVDTEYPDLSGASRFVLCPTGDDVYSFRFVEALSCGAIPVILGDGWVLPFSELEDVCYDAFAILLPEAQAARTAAVLRAVPPEAQRLMQVEGARVFATYFSTLDGQLEAVAAIVRARGASPPAPTRYQTPDGGTHRGENAVACGGDACAAPEGATACDAPPASSRLVAAAFQPRRTPPQRTRGAACATTARGGCRGSFRRRTARLQL